MSLKDKKVYIRKSGNQTLYKWSPQTTITDNNTRITPQGEFCTAKAYQVDGEDKVTKYVTKLIMVNGILKHNAYVSCNYVK